MADRTGIEWTETSLESDYGLRSHFYGCDSCCARALAKRPKAMDTARYDRERKYNGPDFGSTRAHKLLVAGATALPSQATPGRVTRSHLAKPAARREMPGTTKAGPSTSTMVVMPTWVPRPSVNSGETSRTPDSSQHQPVELIKLELETPNRQLARDPKHFNSSCFHQSPRVREGVNGAQSCSV